QMLFALSDQDAFDPSKRSPANFDCHTFSQVRIRIVFQPALHQFLDGCNLLIRNRRDSLFAADKVDYARGLKHGYTKLRSDAYKDVSAEERKLHFLDAIGPAAGHGPQGKKDFDIAICQVRGNLLFMSRSRVNRVPPRFDCTHELTRHI